MTDDHAPRRARLSHGELVALLADTSEYRNELRIDLIRTGQHAALLEAFDRRG